MLVRTIKLGTIATAIAFTGILAFNNATTYAQRGPQPGNIEQRPAVAQLATEEARERGGSWLTREEKQALIAGVLGMSVEDLTAAKEAGQSMEEIVLAQGMTVEEFEAAKQTAMIAAVNQAVTDGELTQEEADAIIERIENGGKGQGNRGGTNWLTREEKQALIADVLGMSVEELTAAKEADQSMEEIVLAQGMTVEEFEAAKQVAMIAAVNQAVTDGELTQEEADAIIERIENGGRGDGNRGDGNKEQGNRGNSSWLTQEEKEALKADVLGMNVDELAAAKEAGQSFEEIVQTQGMTTEEFRTALNAALIAVVEQAVTDGELTQEQADRIVQRIESDKGNRGSDDDTSDADTDVDGLSILSFASSVTEVAGTSQTVQIFMPIVMR